MTAATSEDHSPSRRTITSFFDDRAAAEQAVEALVDAGITRRDVTLATGHDGSAPAEHRSLWEQVKDFFLPAADRYAHAEGLRNGAYVVTVHTTDAMADAVFDIVERYGSIDMDAQEATWREEGRQGSASAGLDDASPVPREERVPPQLDPAESEAQIRAPVGEPPRADRLEHGRLSARGSIRDDL